MNRDAAFALFMVAFGGILAVHCPRAALREYRGGVGVGRNGLYSRATMPFHFWMTIFGTAAAGVFGAIFVAFGVLELFALWSINP